ncbi:MAG: FtsX-like permease family protein [Myxococcota bacterium]|nr:FtsX-like permease family protein [Myxococcota bacterium]
MIRRSLIKLAARNALRNRSRSLLTAGMIVAGTALFINALAWTDGIWDSILESSSDATGHFRVVTPAHAERESLRPIDENIEDVGALLESLRAVPGVETAFPYIESGVTLSVGEEIGDVFGLATGAPQDYYLKHLKVDQKLVEGRWFEPGKEELVLGAKLVERTGAKLGDEVVLLGMTQDGSMSPVKGTLVGIVRSGGPSIDRRAFLDFPTMEWMLDLEGGAMKVVVYGEDYKRIETLGAALRGTPSLQTWDIQSWEELPPWDAQIGIMRGVRAMLVIIIVVLAGLGVWNTMMMSVFERKTEIGVLRALGMTRFEVVFIFVFEAFAIAVIGGVAGVIAGLIPALYMERIGVELPASILSQVDIPMDEIMYSTVTPDIVTMAFWTAFLTALFGSFIPAIRAAMLSPVNAMKREV